MGSAATTSLATSPARNGARAAARPCATAPAAAASRGSSPLARKEATTPVSTSPVPAVASALRRRAADEDALARRSHERVGALQEADAAEPVGGAPHRVEPPGVHLRRVLPEQPGQLARVRRKDRRARRQGPGSSWKSASASRTTGTSSSASSRSRERAGLVGPPHARPDRHRARLRRPCRRRASHVVFTASSSRVSTTGSDVLGHRDGDPARVRSEGGLGGEAGGARQPGRAADDEDRAGGVLRVRRSAAAARGRGSCRSTSRCSVSTSSSPMSATTTSPAWKRPGATWRPTFGPPNVTVAEARTAAPAISPVEASTPDGTSTARPAPPPR